MGGLRAAGWFVLGWVLLAWTTWHVMFSRARLDATGIHQTWIWDKHMAYDELAQAGIETARDPFELARAKEMAHHYRWRASKVNPGEYGEKLDLNAKVSIKDVPDDELLARAARLTALLAGGAA